MFDVASQRTMLEEPEPRYGREYVGFNDVTKFFVRNVWILAIWMGLGLAASIVYLNHAQTIFTAHAQILIEPKLPQILRDRPGEGNFTLDSSQVESHIAVLRSQAIALSVIKRLGLTEDPEFQTKEQYGFATMLKYILPLNKPTTPEKDTRANVALERFENGLGVRRVGISYALDVAFASRDAKKAALIANATVAEYLQSLIDARAAATRAASDWLESRVAQLRVQMNRAARRAQEFRASQDYRINKKVEDPASKKSKSGQSAANEMREPTTLQELELTEEIYGKIYESFYMAFAEAVHRQSYPVSRVRIVSNALVPAHKSHPKTIIILALGILVGLLVGLAIAAVRQMSNKTAHLPQ